MKKQLTALALLLGAGLLAGEWRIDLDSRKSGVDLEIKETSPKNFTILDSPWYKEKQKQRIELRCESFDEWKPCSFTFVPNKDGVVKLCVMSKYTKPGETPSISAYDKFEVKNAEIKNGSFEATVPNHGWIPGWNTQAGLMKGGAADGEYYMTASFKRGCSQELNVKAGVPVTVSFMVKNATW